MEGGASLTQVNRYNHEGMRIFKSENGSSINYYYSNDSLSFTTEGNEVNYANICSNDGNVIGAVHGNSYYIYLNDMQGSTSAILNQSMQKEAIYSYSDFGETKVLYGEDTFNEICYTGAVYDSSTGRYYLSARYYDPETAVFISQDSYRGEPADYTQWHLYAYCANNPINYMDPSGHLSISRGWVGIILDVAFMAFCPYASWAYDGIGETLKYAYKSRKITRLSDKLIYSAAPKIKSIYGKYYRKIGTQIRKATGYSIKIGSTCAINELLKRLFNPSYTKIKSYYIDEVIDCFSLGGAIAVFLDWITDRSLDNYVKVY